MPTTQPSGPDETNLLLHGSGVVRRLGLGERPPYLEVDTGASGYRVVPGTQELFEALRQLPASALLGRVWPSAATCARIRRRHRSRPCSWGSRRNYPPTMIPHRRSHDQ
ncbi:hypothetical protein [Glutamicibacter creatinolyticus]|uniref:hypothetical protein n=1 Tax=Glutamicibacter creatinolyticus TaxID=162496 RepID=UPI001110596C|nr:hypothetical protein [Glutamicibacter creatinolyticus]